MRGLLRVGVQGHDSAERHGGVPYVLRVQGARPGLVPACFCPECRAVVTVHEWKGHAKRCSGKLRLVAGGDPMPVTGLGPTCEECHVRAVAMTDDDGKGWCWRCWYLVKAFR